MEKRIIGVFNIDDNLLALNQLLILVSSSFIFSSKTLMSLHEKSRFVSSANIFGFSAFEASCRPFTYKRNNNCPKMDPAGTTYVTVALLVEKINCLQFFKSS